MPLQWARNMFKTSHSHPFMVVRMSVEYLEVYVRWYHLWNYGACTTNKPLQWRVIFANTFNES